MMEFVNKWTYKPKLGFNMSKCKCVTQKYGYIPVKQQIANLMAAGKRLDAFRSGMYLYNAGSTDMLSGVDTALANLGYYADKLSIEERVAFVAGAKRAFVEYQQKNASDEAKVKASSEKWTKLVSMFESPTEVKVTPEDNEQTV